MRYRALVGFAVLTAVAPVPASAQPSSRPAVALVLDVRGATEPAIKPYREMRVGESVRLSSGARLVVLQYGQAHNTGCRTLTVEGGMVTFRQGDPVIQGGVTSAQDGKCPRKLVAKSTSGAIIVRGVATRLPQMPSFTIAGARGSEVGALRILEVRMPGEAPAPATSPKLAEIPVKGQDFKWPADTPMLPGNRLYTVEFLSRDNTAVLASMTIFAAAPADEDVPTVIFVE